MALPLTCLDVLQLPLVARSRQAHIRDWPGDWPISRWKAADVQVIANTINDPPLSVAWHSNEKLTRRGRYQIPSEFFATFHMQPRVALWLRLEASQQVVHAVEITRTKDSGSLNTTNLRVALEPLARAAGQTAAHIVRKGKLVSVAVLTPEEKAELLGLVEQRRKGRRIDDAFLQRVADVYREALASGQPPTNMVARELHGSRSIAGRWVMKARAKGLLGKAKAPGQAGEKG